jgi:hypothetical protein
MNTTPTRKFIQAVAIQQCELRQRDSVAKYWALLIEDRLSTWQLLSAKVESNSHRYVRNYQERVMLRGREIPLQHFWSRFVRPKI